MNAIPDGAEGASRWPRHHALPLLAGDKSRWEPARLHPIMTGRSSLFAGTAFEPQAGFAQSEAEQALGLAADRVDIEGALGVRNTWVEAEIEAGRL